MEELQDLIKFLKDKGLGHRKINVDVLCGIIEYFANKQETKQCNIADVVGQSEQLPIECIEDWGTPLYCSKQKGSCEMCKQGNWIQRTSVWVCNFKKQINNKN